MSDPVVRHRSMTVEEYRAFEATSNERHEYVDGMIYAMTGASRRHNRIVGNVYRRLADAADNGPCRVYMESVRVRVAERLFYYPDVVVACGEPGDEHEENAPCVLVEVLSPSTETTDRREKTMFYRQKQGLVAYVIVHQDQRLVHAHVRDGDAWYETSYRADDDVLSIPCLDVQLTVAEIYAGVEREGGEPLASASPRRVREAEPVER